MTLEYLKNYWPFILFISWQLYKWQSRRQVKKILPELRKKDAVTIDVRKENEFLKGHYPETINIPLQEIKNRLSEIPRDVPVILCCASGARSGLARRYLKRQGFKEIYNIGSWTNLNTQLK